MGFGATTRSRLVLFGGLYFAQGVPWGFVTGALIYWLGILPGKFILPGLAPVMLGLVAAAIFHRAVTGRDHARPYFSICGAAALLQVVTVLIFLIC